MTPEDIRRTLARIAHEIIERNKAIEHLILVGMRTSDTFKGRNHRTLSESKLKTKVASYQHPYVLLAKDYIW